MLQFHLTKTLSKDLSMHLGIPTPINNSAMQWYAHRITALRRKCIIAMEGYSRYCMVFCGLTKKDFERFPEMFLDRLWREAVSICQLDEIQSEKLAALAGMVAEEYQFQTGSDRSVQSHINDVAWQLKDIAEEIGYLPIAPEDAFGFGIRVNEQLRICKGDKDYFRPIEDYREFWLGMLQQLAPSATTAPSITDNVIPFRRK